MFRKVDKREERRFIFLSFIYFSKLVIFINTGQLVKNNTFYTGNRILDFTELHGIYSGENLAAAVEALLVELYLESKLIAITGDNTSNNKAMAYELHESLKNRLSSPLLFKV